MKYKTTAKAIRNGYRNIVSVGYCSLATLLKYKSPSAYTCGVYGWNFDLYEFGGLAITTGYRGMIGRQAEHVSEYEKKAREIEDRNITWDDEKQMINDLLDEFIKLNGGSGI